MKKSSRLCLFAGLAACAASPALGQVLYDNGPLVTNPGAAVGGRDASALQTGLGLTIYGFGAQQLNANRIADDFTVPAGGWNIGTITFYSYQTGATTPTINGINVQIWNGDPSLPTSSVVFGDTTTNRLSTTTPVSLSNIMRPLDTNLLEAGRQLQVVTADINTTLPAGTYWLDWQFNGTLASGPWQPPVTLLGQTGKPGANGLQSLAGVWGALVDGVNPQDAPFIINGPGGAATGACCLPDGSCIVVSSSGCAAANGIYRGNNAPCATANCPQPATGACCLSSGCSILTQAQCLAGNGTYRGDNTSCATAGCAVPCPPITGAIGGPSVGWPSTHGQQNGRLFRDGVPDTCAAPGVPGTPIAGSFGYDKYDFTNTSGAPVCVQVDINTACTGTNFIYAGAYIGAYDPNNPVTNNVASIGGSPNPTASMSFTVPANAAFSIVFAEVTTGAGCSAYTFQLSGGALNCLPAASCYANCDNSTSVPFLNVNDFICFQTKFAAGDSYANCDNSTSAPVLNVNDFICFQTKFAAGCSAP